MQSRSGIGSAVPPQSDLLAMQAAAQEVMRATSSAQAVVAWFGDEPGWLRVGRKGRPDDVQLENALGRLREHWLSSPQGITPMEDVEKAVAVPLGEAGAAKGALLLVRPAEPNDVLSALRPLGPLLALMACCVARCEGRQDHSAVQLRLQAVLDTVTDAVLSINAEGIIKWANRATTEIFGWEAGELVGNNISVLVPAPHTERHDHYIKEYIAGKPSAVVGGGRRIASGLRRDGEIFPVELSVSEAWDQGTRFFVGVVRDISKRQAMHAEQSILASELRAVLEASASGIVAFDSRGEVRHANNACADLLGVGVEELRGMRMSEVDDVLQANSDKPEEYVGLSKTSQDAESLLYVHTPRKAVLRRTLRRSQSLGTEEGRVMFLRDVTREHEVDRMKTEFLATAAHELRTPMASIHGFAELLLKREFDRDVRQDMISTIHRQSSAMVELVNELLDLARIEARAGKDFRIRPCGLRDLLKAVCEDMRGDARGRQINLHLPDRDLPAWADYDKLRLAVVNVISNALKYSPADRPVDVALGYLPGPDQVEIRVSDRGGGMTMEQIERIFDRFYRADPTGPIPGTGLGMTLVKEILTILEGSVKVLPREGGGLVVSLLLRPVENVASERLVGN